MQRRRNPLVTLGIVAVLMHGCSGFAGLVPCEYQNAAFAQDPPAPDPTPAPEVTAEIVAPEVAEPGTFVSVSLKTNGSKVNVRWLFDGKADPAHFRPINGRSAVVTALAGEHTLAIFGTIDDTPILVQRVVTFGEPEPPQPPKPINQLVTGENAAKLATLYRAMATLPPPTDFWAAHDGLVAERGIVLSADAVKALHARLDGLADGALTGELSKIADELAKPVPPGPQPDPVPVAGLRVLVVEETNDRGKLPADQIPVIAGTTVRNYVTKNGGIWRVVDDDDDVSKLAPEWQKMRGNVTLPSPAWAVYTTKGGTVAPLPATEDAAIAELQRVAQ